MTDPKSGPVAIGRPTPAEIAATLATAVGVPAELIGQLHEINREQWCLEDVTRAAPAPNSDVAIAKRKIDVCNSRRHQTIDAIDRHVHARVANWRAANWYTETVGELCDRLLILDLKSHSLRSNASTPARHLAEIEDACLYFAEATSRLAYDILEQRAMLPPRIGVKIYNSLIDAATIESTTRSGNGGDQV